MRSGLIYFAVMFSAFEAHGILQYLCLCGVLLPGPADSGQKHPDPIPPWQDEKIYIKFLQIESTVNSA